MKLESLKMNLKSLKSRANNQKNRQIKGKITKSSITFSENKPNSPIVQTEVTFLTAMNYPIYASLTKVKNKPNQTQFKPNFTLDVSSLSFLSGDKPNRKKARNER